MNRPRRPSSSSGCPKAQIARAVAVGHRPDRADGESPVASVAATAAPGASSCCGKPPSGPAGAASTVRPAPRAARVTRSKRAAREAGHGERRGERAGGSRQRGQARRARGAGGLRGCVAQHLLDRRDEHHVAAVLADALRDRRRGPRRHGPRGTADRGAREAGPDAGGVHGGPRYAHQQRGPLRPAWAPITSRISTSNCEISVPRITDRAVHFMPGLTSDSGMIGSAACAAGASARAMQGWKDGAPQQAPEPSVGKPDRWTAPRLRAPIRQSVDGPFGRRQGGAVQSTLAEFQETQSRGCLRAPEREAAQGAARQGHDPGQAGIDGRLPGRGQLRARGLRRDGKAAEEGDDRRGHFADEDVRHGRGLPGRRGAGDSPAPPGERRDHRQRAQPPGLRRRASTGTSSAWRAPPG